MKSTILIKDRKYRYFDKNGVEIHEGDMVRSFLGNVYKVYLTEDGELGTDATNPKWIETGRAVPCEYGIYPFTEEDMKLLRVIK